jgi:ribosomal protein L16 Arg81 hydroxylase
MTSLDIEHELTPESGRRDGGDRPLIHEAFGISVEQFDAEVRSKCWRIGHTPRLGNADLLTWRQLNDVLAAGSRRMELVQVSKNGKRLDPSHYVKPEMNGFVSRFSAPAIARCLREGYSLILNSVDAYHSPAEELVRRLTRELGESVLINAYVSWTSDQCFTTHWDDHDVLIIQTDGEKEWSVFEPTRKHPMKRDVECEISTEGLTPAWRGVLRRGDVLYLPRGWWHHAKSTGQGSIHLTCGFVNRTAMDVLAYLLDEACADERMRADLTRPRGGRAGADAAKIIALMAELLKTEDHGNLIDRFWRRHASTLPLQHEHMLPYSLDLDLFGATDHHLALATAARSISLETHDDRFAIEAGNRRWELALAAKPLLELFLDGQVRRLSELTAEPPGDLGQNEVVELVFELANDGLLSVRPAA